MSDTSAIFRAWLDTRAVLQAAPTVRGLYVCAGETLQLAESCLAYAPAWTDPARYLGDAALSSTLAEVKAAVGTIQRCGLVLAEYVTSEPDTRRPDIASDLLPACEMVWRAAQAIPERQATMERAAQIFRTEILERVAALGTGVASVATGVGSMFKNAWPLLLATGAWFVFRRR